MPHQCTNCSRTFADGSKEMLSGCPDCGGNKFQFAPAKTSTGAGGGTSASASGGTGGTDHPDSNPRSTTTGDDAGAVSRAAETVRDWVSDSSDETVARSSPSTGSGAGSDSFPEWPETARRPADRKATAASDDGDDSVDFEDQGDRDGSADADADTNADATEFEFADGVDDEDTAQADARSQVVSPDELPSRSEPPGDDVDLASVDRPDHGRVVSEPSGDRPTLEQLREELNDQFESIKIVRPGQYELNLMELYDREEYIVSLQEDGRYVIDVPDSWRDADE